MLTRDFQPFAMLLALLNGEDGGALVETALTLPLLVTMVLGPVELARVAYTAIEVSNAAKAGATYGGQNGGAAGDTAGITWAATHDGANIQGLSVSSVSLSYICSDGSASTGLNTDCANSQMEETVTVVTQATIDPLIHIPGLPTTYTVHGKASQMCLQ
jgi:Flp pilus assembly protein TadG